MRTYSCEDCGALCRRKRTSYDPRVCLSCAEARVVDNATQLHEARLLRLAQRRNAGALVHLAARVDSGPQRGSQELEPAINNPSAMAG